MESPNKTKQTKKGDIKMYVITDGKQYIHRNRKGAFVLEELHSADLYDVKSKAENVLNNCLCQKLKAKCYVIQNSDERGQSKSSDTTQVLKSLAETTIETANELEQSIEVFQNLVNDITKRKETLWSKLSDLDQEISDINHYIEFKKLNAYQGWLACQMLKIRFEKRRKIKNQISVLNVLCDSKIKNETVDNIYSLMSKKKLTYTPRKLITLFGEEGSVHYEL